MRNVSRQMFRCLFERFAAIVLFAAFLTSVQFHAALAQVAPSLGTAQSFAVLGASTVTNTGPTIVTGDLGVSPGAAVTGFPPGIVVGGTIHAADAVALQAQSDTTIAYNNLAGQACDFNLTGQDLGGMTLVPGVYCFPSTSAQLTGTLTLDAGGNPNAVWVFQIGSTLTTASNSSVLFINGAQPCNVFWQVGSSATIGTGTTFVGNILALTSISLNTNATLSGRALARTGAVTMDSNTIAVTTCSVPPVTPIPPTLSKAFSRATINAGGTSTLTITLSNPDNAIATLSAPFTDTLPSGVVIATSPNASTTCGGNVTATAGGSTVTLTGGAIPANASCTVTVDVTAPAGGSYFNSLAAGVLQTSNGNNAAPAVATLTVIPPVDVIPPTVSKAFNPATINAGGTSTLTITLSNSDNTPATLTAPLIDTLPSGVVIAATPNVSTTCGGAVTAPAGGSTVTLTGGTIPANGSCTVTVDVTAPAGGSYFNSLAAGALQTSNGNNAAPAIATLTVIPPAGDVPPTVGKAFNPATIDAGGVSTLTITLSNSDNTPATLTAPLIDTLPSGAVIAATPNALATCGGAVTATAGGSTVTLASGSTIPANGSCTVTVNVTAPVGGSYINSLGIGALQTNHGINAAPAVATLTVIPPAGVVPPTLGKAFNPATINADGVSTLTITLSNPNSTIATLTAPLIDALPSGVVIAATPNASTTCGGAVTAPAGGSTVTLASGSTIPANGSCTVTVNVTAPVGGSYFNSLAIGDLQTNHGVNAAPAVATLTVLPPAVVIIPPTLSKTFNPATINAGGTSTLTITLSNPDSTIATLTAPLIDTLPSGMVIATPPNAATTCGNGVVTAPAGGSTVTLASGSTIPANGSCTVTVNVTAQAAGSYVNSLGIGALQTNHGVNAAPVIVTLTVIPVIPQTPGLSLTKTPNMTTYTSVGQVIVYTYVLKNTGDVPLTGPFTVTDDKLGTFTCGSATSLAPGASVTCTKNYTIKADDLGNVVSLPTGVSANIDTSVWLQASMSTQSMIISGATPGVPNGMYPGWCIQDYVDDDLHNQLAKLYSTIGGNLPFDVAGLPWNKVNYVLNNKIRGAGKTDLQFFKDVQTAIWVLLGEPNPEFGISATAQQMINAANANANFVPGPDDIVAVIIYSDGMLIFPRSIQEAICEMKLLQSIVNKATGSGKFGTVVVQSGQVEVTINQILKTTPLPPADIAPKLSKSFSPATIKAGKVSKLTITLKNTNSTPATQSAPLTDYLPSGMTISGNADTTCGGTLTAKNGNSNVTLTGGTILANGSCTVKVNVTAKQKGSYKNKLPVGALKTNKGSNTTEAVATLTVTK